MANMQERHPETLAAQLTQAWQKGVLLDTPFADQVPENADAAFAIQHEIIARRGVSVAGWKVGAKSIDGPIQGCPLPATTCYASGTRLSRQAFNPLGLELEIGLRFARVLEPRAALYTEDEVLAAIGTMEATIEIVATRYRAWPNVDKLLQLADLQCHGALISGAAIPYASSFPFESPGVQFRFGDADITGAARPANPAGDPRRLLTWLVNHCTHARRLALTPDMIVTTGSYTGMFPLVGAGLAYGTIDGLPPVRVELHD
jgi:2-keto-4-pentenoate hydratase